MHVRHYNWMAFYYLYVVIKISSNNSFREVLYYFGSQSINNSISCSSSSSIVVVVGASVVVTGLEVVVAVAVLLFKRLTDGLPNHSGTNSSITHNPLGLRAKSVLYTGEISADNYKHAVKTF